MKIILPKEYKEYFNTDVFVARKSSNSVLLLTEDELNMVKINSKKPETPISRFILSGVVKAHTEDNILVLPHGFVVSSEVIFLKEKLGLLILENKKHHI